MLCYGSRYLITNTTEQKKKKNNNVITLMCVHELRNRVRLDEIEREKKVKQRRVSLGRIQIERFTPDGRAPLKPLRLVTSKPQ